MSDKQSYMPTILLIEEDDETRRLLVENLRGRGYQIIITVDKENAIDWISNTVKHPDMILINQVNCSLSEYQQLITDIHHQGKIIQEIPTIILAESYATELEGREEKVSEKQYLVYLRDVEQLFALLDRVYDLDRA